MGDARAGGALLLIDEIDAIPDRAKLSDRAREWWSALLAQILAVTDGVNSREGLILLGCTNAGSSAAPASSLDAALVRPGRFGKIIWVNLPSEADLAAIVAHWLSGALSADALLPAVRLGVGASAADAAAWARVARNLASDAGRAVEVADVLSVIAPADQWSDADRWRAAVHKSAHAVALVHLGGRVESASIVQRGLSGGRTEFAAGAAFPTVDDVHRAAIVGLSGRAGEEIIVGSVSLGAEGDLADVTQLLARAHASAGMGGTLLHLAPAGAAASLLLHDLDLRRAVDQHVRRAYDAALLLVRDRRDAIGRVAEALFRRRFLAGDEIRRLVEAPATGGEP